MNGARPHFDHDLRVGEQAEVFVTDVQRSFMAGSVTIETKNPWSRDTFVEVEHMPPGCDTWRPSGVARTTSGLWAWVHRDRQALLIVPTERVKDYARTHYARRTVAGADGSNPTRGLWVPWTYWVGG